MGCWILASDIDSNVLAQAKAGIYPLARVEICPGAPEGIFPEGKRCAARKAKVRDVLRRYIAYARSI